MRLEQVQCSARKREQREGANPAGAARQISGVELLERKPEKQREPEQKREALDADVVNAAKESRSASAELPQQFEEPLPVEKTDVSAFAL